ncbi:MAG: hypothetical protein B7733_10230 [Myxococcales bacterium FL481]|nr:MAG: hypothetical protein B7733_10230 [Myxococcales bacterium FL481]
MPNTIQLLYPSASPLPLPVKFKPLTTATDPTLALVLDATLLAIENNSTIELVIEDQFVAPEVQLAFAQTIVGTVSAEVQSATPTVALNVANHVWAASVTAPSEVDRVEFNIKATIAVPDPTSPVGNGTRRFDVPFTLIVRTAPL